MTHFVQMAHQRQAGVSNKQDIKALKALQGNNALQNYATQNGDIYTLSSTVFSGNDALVKPTWQDDLICLNFFYSA